MTIAKNIGNDYYSFSRYSSLLINGFILLILIISANFIGTIFPKSVIQKFDTYYLPKHIIIFLSCMIYCIINNGQIQNFQEQVITAILIYILFLLFIKVPFTIFIIIIILSLLSYLIYSYKTLNISDIDNYYIGINTDNIKLLDNNNLYIYNTLTYIQSGIFIIIIFLCVIGAINKFNYDFKKYYKKLYNNNMPQFIFDFIFKKIKKHKYI